MKRAIGRKTSNGFSMIEVLVSLLVICVGVLGMVAMQWRSIQYTQETALRNAAIMLADDLIELMRSNPASALSDELFSSNSPYYKALSAEFQTETPQNCMSRDRSAGGDAVAKQDVSCWLQQVKTLLPVTDDIINSSFAVCPISNPDSCSTNSESVVMIRMAWPDKSGQCESDICIYTLRTEL